MSELRIVDLTGAVTSLAHTDLRGLAGADGVVAVADVVDVSGDGARATHCTAISRDGSYRASLPIATMLSAGRITVLRNGRVLDAAQGGPLRLTVVEGDTLCWNVKHLEELRLSIGALPDDVPANPPH